MPKEKPAPQRMKPDAAGNLRPERFFKGWVEAQTYEAIQELAAQNLRPTAEEIRQAMRHWVDFHKNGEGLK